MATTEAPTLSVTFNRKNLCAIAVSVSVAVPVTGEALLFKDDDDINSLSPAEMTKYTVDTVNAGYGKGRNGRALMDQILRYEYEDADGNGLGYVRSQSCNKDDKGISFSSLSLGDSCCCVGKVCAFKDRCKCECTDKGCRICMKVHGYATALCAHWCCGCIRCGSNEV
jgi:hypothetical protein